ncbi:MAG: SDR family NAD(P)-dependent oxidoreductase, partial [Burkholderiaceae bacterium]
MQLLLNNKKCIVTGASQGLGKAIAILLAAEQCDLVLVARRKKPLEEVKNFIQKKHNNKVAILSIDVTSKNADTKIRDFALKQLG